MPNTNHTFIAQCPNQLPEEYRLLFTITPQEGGPCYMVYTDGTQTEDGSTCVYASVYEPDRDSGFLLPIETDWEWALIKQALARYTAAMEIPDVEHW